MRDDQPSTSADGAAAFRAAGTLDPDPRRRNPDSLAATLTSDGYRRLLGRPRMLSLVLAFYDWQVRGLYAAHQARTLYLDARLRHALDEGIGQLVLLGAGMDSRAYRFVDRLAGVRVVEVDHPATQRVKRARLARAGIAHDHVTFLPVDFEQEGWEAQVLATLDVRRVTWLLWEGVTPYLTPAAVGRVAAVAAACASGSRLVFDYLVEDFVSHPERYPGGRRHVRWTARRGEPYKLGFTPASLDALAQAHGMRVTDHVTGAELEADYRIADAGREPVPPFSAIVELTVD